MTFRKVGYMTLHGLPNIANRFDISYQSTKKSTCFWRSFIFAQVSWCCFLLIILTKDLGRCMKPDNISYYKLHLWMVEYIFKIDLHYILFLAKFHVKPWLKYRQNVRKIWSLLYLFPLLSALHIRTRSPTCVSWYSPFWTMTLLLLMSKLCVLLVEKKSLPENWCNTVT